MPTALLCGSHISFIISHRTLVSNGRVHFFQFWCPFCWRSISVSGWGTSRAVQKKTAWSAVHFF